MTSIRLRPLALTLLSILIISCLIRCADDEEKPFVAVNTNTLQVSSTTTTQKIAISASGEWTASADQTWIKLSATNGRGSGEITVDTEANLAVVDRTGNVTIATTGAPSQIIEISQRGCDPILKISRQQVTFITPYIGTDTLKLNCNTSWTVAADQPWLVITPTGGNGDAILTLTTTANPDVTARTLTLTISTTDKSLSRTVNVTQSGHIAIVAGGNGMGSGLTQLNFPSSVCVVDDGSMFITDQFNNRVVKWMPGSLQGAVVAGGHGEGNAVNQLNSPYGIFVTANGDMFIGDNVNHRIMKWTAGSSSGTMVAGGNGYGFNANQVSAPDGVFVDAEGYLYISEAATHRVSKWQIGAASGITIAEGAPIQFTTAMTLDGEGNVYIASGDNSNVTKWIPGASAGIVVAGGNDRGIELNQLNGPSGVFVDGDGNLFVTEQVNDRVVKWAPGSSTGIVVAGGKGKGANLDQLNSPSGIWVDKDGSIFISDQGNNRVIKYFK